MVEVAAQEQDNANIIEPSAMPASIIAEIAGVDITAIVDVCSDANILDLIVLQGDQKGRSIDQIVDLIDCSDKEKQAISRRLEAAYLTGERHRLLGTTHPRLTNLIASLTVLYIFHSP